LKLTATVIARGLLLGLAQLALLAIIALNTDSHSRVFTLELSAIVVFPSTLFMGFHSSGADEFLKALIIAEMIVWPVLVFNAVPTLRSSGFGSLVFAESFVLGFCGFVLLGASLFGGLVGSYIRMFHEPDHTPPEFLDELAELAPLKLSDEELLAKYRDIRSRLRSEEDWNEGDRIVLSRVASELTRRGLTEPSANT
jgi:hypothetical protein